MHKAKHDLTTSDGGRGYIADLFRDKLERHDFSGYIGERLAADFACFLSAHMERQAARIAELEQQRGECVAVDRELLLRIAIPATTSDKNDALAELRAKLAQQGKAVGDE